MYIDDIIDLHLNSEEFERCGDGLGIIMSEIKNNKSEFPNDVNTENIISKLNEQQKQLYSLYEETVY